MKLAFLTMAWWLPPALAEVAPNLSQKKRPIQPVPELSET
jgi:hypothetical protein